MEEIKVQKRRQEGAGPDATGIPPGLRRDFQRRSGLSLEDVRVHYGSGRPARLGASAYTLGTQVYLGPGQERFLPHELGHVVQQKTRPVPATRAIGGLPVNDDPALEAEADRWAAGARQGRAEARYGGGAAQCGGGPSVPQQEVKPQTAPARQSAPVRQTGPPPSPEPLSWVGTVYLDALARMPPTEDWKGLSRDKTAVGKGLSDLAFAIDWLRAQPTTLVWGTLKLKLLALSEMGEAELGALGERRSDVLGRLTQIKEASAQAERMMESMVTDLSPKDSPREVYADLPAYITAAVRMVGEAVRRLTDSTPDGTGATAGDRYYRYYFAPAREDASGQESQRAVAHARQSRSHADHNILPPLAPFQGTEEPEGTGREYLLRRQELLRQPPESEGGPPGRMEDWAGLQQYRPSPGPAGLSEEDRALAAGLPDRLPPQEEAPEGGAGEPGKAQVLFRYRRILEGLEWLSREPYLKVIFAPKFQKSWANIHSEKGSPRLIRLFGAFHRNARIGGANSRPGTLIHELSHGFAGTEDRAYDGMVFQLRESSAVLNADTYRCAAEGKKRPAPRH